MKSPDQNRELFCECLGACSELVDEPLRGLVRRILRPDTPGAVQRVMPLAVHRSGRSVTRLKAHSPDWIATLQRLLPAPVVVLPAPVARA